MKKKEIGPKVQLDSPIPKHPQIGCWPMRRPTRAIQYGPALTTPCVSSAHFASNPTATGNEMAPCYTNTRHTTGMSEVRTARSSVTNSP
jgi:hypothetical protein